MKTLIALLLMALPAIADVTKADIKKLVDAKVSDSVITAYVRTNAPVRMTPDDLVSLKNAGASDTVLTVLASNMRTNPSPVRTEVVYVYQPTYYRYGWYYYPVRRYYRPVTIYRPVVRTVRCGGHR